MATTVPVTYVGHEFGQCHELADYNGGSAQLAPGTKLEVPAELAERLAATNALFEVGPRAPKEPTKKELQARARELGLTPPPKASIKQLRAAIAEAEAAAAAALEQPPAQTDDQTTSDAGGAADPEEA